MPDIVPCQSTSLSLTHVPPLPPPLPPISLLKHNQNVDVLERWRSSKLVIAAMFTKTGLTTTLCKFPPYRTPVPPAHPPAISPSPRLATTRHGTWGDVGRVIRVSCGSHSSVSCVFVAVRRDELPATCTHAVKGGNWVNR